MKNTFISIFSLLVLCSCTGFLDEVKTSSLNEEDVYNSEQALETNINGCYLTFHNSSLWKGTMSEYIGSASAMILWGGDRTSSDWLDAMDLTKYSNSTAGNSNVFTALMSGVNRCNRLIDNLPSSPVDTAYKREIEAEARFIRAVLYFTVTRYWGDVPLIKKSPVVDSELYNKREDFEKVYAFILEDLQYAEKNMRSADRVAEVTPFASRPNKMAATAFKSSVYLTIGSLLSSPDDNFWDTSKRTPDFSACGINTALDAFQKAYDSAEEVINSGVYSLVPDYRTLFRWTEPGDWFLSEDILMIPSTNTASNNLIALYTLPPFPEGSSNYITPNTNAGRVRPSRFLIETFIKESGGRKGNQGTYNPYVYCSTTDPRFDATIIVSYVRQDTGKGASYYPTDAKIPTTSSPFFKKYLDPTYDVSNGNADFYLMRLAEVYLISAEAAAELSAQDGAYKAKAIERVNALRQRARKSMDKGESSCPPDFEADNYPDTKSLVNAVMLERFLELAGEGHEYFDTHRRGAQWLLDNIAAPANAFYFLNQGTELPEVNKLYVEYFYKGAYARGRVFPDNAPDLRKSLLLAYPERELRLNTAESRQNDFYWQ